MESILWTRLRFMQNNLKKQISVYNDFQRIDQLKTMHTKSIITNDDFWKDESTMFYSLKTNFEIEQ